MRASAAVSFGSDAEHKRAVTNQVAQASAALIVARSVDVATIQNTAKAVVDKATHAAIARVADARAAAATSPLVTRAIDVAIRSTPDRTPPTSPTRTSIFLDPSPGKKK